MVRKRQVFAADLMKIHLDLRFLDSPLCQAVHTGIGIHRGDFADVLVVVRKIEAGTKPNFQNFLLDAREELLAELADCGISQGEIANARKNDV